MRPLHRYLSLVAALGAALACASAAPPRAAAAPSRPDPAALRAAAQESALRHYLQGVYLEGTGDLRGAMKEIGQAFTADSGAADLALKLSDLALQSGDGAAGLAYARRALALGEKSGHAHFLVGAALVGTGHPEDARVEFEKAAAIDSTDLQTLQALGRIGEELNDLKGARAAYSRAFNVDPEDDEIAYRLGMVEARLEHWGAADTLLAQVAETNPTLPALTVTRAFIAERQGRVAEAAKGYAAHLAMFPNDRATRQRLVQAYVRLEDWTDATREGRAVYDQAPDDFDAGRVLASLYLTEKRDADAVGVVHSLRRHLPGQVDPSAFAVAVLIHVGRLEDARAEADGLTRERPKDARSWIVAAEAWASKEGDEKGAREADLRYAKAELLLPDSTGARAELARSFSRTRRFERAEKMLETALAKEPKEARLWLELAFARERRKDVPGAEEAARKSLDLEPRNGQALNFLGYLYADYKVKVDQALPLIEEALAGDPDNPYYIDSLGWAYYRLGRLEDARGQLERAVALGAEEAEVLEHLGDVYVALARKHDAKSLYQKALQLDPTKQSLSRKLEALH